MTTFNDVSEYTTARILATSSLDQASFYLFDNRIFFVRVNEQARVTMDLVNEGIKFILQHGDGGKYYTIFDFKSFSDADPEVRDWAAGHNSTRISKMDALVISSLSHKIVADFYLKFSKPKLPTKVFTDLQKAFDWMHKAIELDQANSN